MAQNIFFTFYVFGENVITAWILFFQSQGVVRSCLARRPKPFGRGTVGNPMTSQILAWLHPTWCKHLCWCAEPSRSYFTGPGSLIYQAEPNSVKCHRLLGFDRVTTRCDSSLFARDGAHASDMT